MCPSVKIALENCRNTVLQGFFVSRICSGKEILYKCNVLTLPYDRYLYSDDVYYYFRVNLMINREKLYKAIESLQNGFNI